MVSRAQTTSQLVNTVVPMTATASGLVPTPPNDPAKYLNGTGVWTTPAGAGSGTVTTLSVVTANGLAGTVANPSTTPAITLTTSVTGVLKGNGTAISAASGADLPVMTATVGGAVPTPPNSALQFLNGAGAFSTPSGGGNVSNVATPTSGQVAEWTSATTLQGVSTTGSSSYVRATSPTLVTPALGTPTSGNLSNCLADGTNAVGFRHVPQIPRSAAYTTVLTDAGKHILHPSADTTARVFTIDSNANVAYPIGTAITFVNQNAGGTVTIAITTDTMRLAGAGTTGSRTLAANGIATALKLTSTEWIISGTGLT